MDEPMITSDGAVDAELVSSSPRGTVSLSCRKVTYGTAALFTRYDLEITKKMTDADDDDITMNVDVFQSGETNAAIVMGTSTDGERSRNCVLRPLNNKSGADFTSRKGR